MIARSLARVEPLDHDAIVIGAGPAGTVAARELAREGRRVALVEAKRSPRPKVCAGGISPWARKNLERLELWDRIASEAHEVTGVHVVAPSGRETVWMGAASAVVIPRLRLDHILARAAVEAGARLLEGCPVVALETVSDGVIAARLADGTVLRAAWIIDASGARSRFGAESRSRRRLRACLGRYEGIDFDSRVIELVFDGALAPHYGWLFPESTTVANVGICFESATDRRVRIRDVFSRFLERHFGSRLSKANPLDKWRSFPISVGGAVRHGAQPRVLLAGEACGLVNPATGEGISYAVSSGQIAARCVDRALDSSGDPTEIAAAYEARLRARHGLSLAAGDWFCRHGAWLVEAAVGFGSIAWIREAFGQEKGGDVEHRSA